MLKLYKNTAQCLHCLDIITSTHVHDYRACKCGKVKVDGGNEYTRRGWSGGLYNDSILDLVEYVDIETGEIFKDSVEVGIRLKIERDERLKMYRSCDLI